MIIRELYGWGKNIKAVERKASLCWRDCHIPAISQLLACPCWLMLLYFSDLLCLWDWLHQHRAGSGFSAWMCWMQELASPSGLAIRTLKTKGSQRIYKYQILNISPAIPGMLLAVSGCLPMVTNSISPFSPSSLVSLALPAGWQQAGSSKDHCVCVMATSFLWECWALNTGGCVTCAGELQSPPGYRAKYSWQKSCSGCAQLC